MVTLPGLESYSKNDLQELKDKSPSCAQYLNLIERKANGRQDQLRQRKHRSWLQCALASLFERTTPEEVCLFWSQQSDMLISEAWQECGLDQTPVSLLALGKLGSHELNLSSDIDIILVRENDCGMEKYQSSIRSFLKLLNETTSFGFLYRVDLNLRPGGDSSPLVPSQAHFYNYYDEYLEAWHRMSFIRLRPLLGPSELNLSLSAYCKRLAFPKRLDFTVIDEIKNIRGKLNYQWRKANEPLDIKFYPGGIRDIELYIHALQVIYGGKRPELQVTRFSDALQVLHQMNILETADYNFFKTFYWHLRGIENLIQMQEDQHTYLVRPEFRKSLMPTLNEQHLIKEFENSHQLVSSFFVSPITPANERKSLDIQKFSNNSQQAVRQILELKSHSLKKSENDDVKHEIIHSYLSIVQKIAIDQELAVQVFRDFIFAIKAKSSIFHLLRRHSELLENLAWLFSVSPFLGQIICRRPELLDSFALGSVSFLDNDDLEGLLDNLHDYKLLGNIVSVTYFLKNHDILSYGKSLSERADFVVQKLLTFLESELNCEGIELLCLGKWGGLELGIQSDLDLIFLSKGEPQQQQIQLARKFINLVTISHSAGKLYNIDLRLKPEETAVPLLINKNKLFDFLKKDADPWQKQAYLRARQLGEKDIFFKDQIDSLWIDGEEKDSLEAVHKRLLTTALDDSLDIKTVLGGIIHTEFCVQKHVLYQRLKPTQSATHHLIASLNLDFAEKLQENYKFLRMFEQAFQICNDSPSTKVARTSASLERVNKILRLQDGFQQLQDVLCEQRELLKKLDLNS